MITIKEIKHELAERAYTGISFSPEKRANSVIASYKETCDTAKEACEKIEQSLKGNKLWKEEYSGVI